MTNLTQRSCDCLGLGHRMGAPEGLVCCGGLNLKGTNQHATSRSYSRAARHSLARVASNGTGQCLVRRRRRRRHEASDAQGHGQPGSHETLRIKHKMGFDVDAIAGYDFGMFRAEAEIG